MSENASWKFTKRRPNSSRDRVVDAVEEKRAAAVEEEDVDVNLSGKTVVVDAAVSEEEDAVGVSGDDCFELTPWCVGRRLERG